MLICPYCSFANPPTTMHCLGCNADLHDDTASGTLPPELDSLSPDIFPEKSSAKVIKSKASKAKVKRKDAPTDVLNIEINPKQNMLSDWDYEQAEDTQKEVFAALSIMQEEDDDEIHTVFNKPNYNEFAWTEQYKHNRKKPQPKPTGQIKSNPYTTKVSRSPLQVTQEGEHLKEFPTEDLATPDPDPTDEKLTSDPTARIDASSLQDLLQLPFTIPKTITHPQSHQNQGESDSEEELTPLDFDLGSSTAREASNWHIEKFPEIKAKKTSKPRPKAEELPPPPVIHPRTPSSDSKDDATALLKPYPKNHAPQAELGLYSHLYVRLDAESTRGSAPLSLGKRLLSLEGVSQRLSMLLRVLDLNIEKEDTQCLVVSAEEGKEGLKSIVEGAHRITEEVHSSYSPTQEARVRIRCVITTNTINDEAHRSHAIQLSKQLCDGMPVDSIWLDWNSHQQLGSELVTQEVLLPSLEEPAYEMSWQLPQRPGKSGTALQDISKVSALLVGRQNEQSQLDQLWGQCQQGNFEVGLVIGEPGSGRSRMLEAWSMRLPRDVEIFWGGAAWCGATRAASPYLVSLLESHLHRSGLERHEGLVHKMGSLAHAEVFSRTEYWQDRLEDLLELWNKEREGDKSLVEAVSWYIQATAKMSPTILIIDDLYMLDRLGRLLLNSIFSSCPKQLMVLVLSAPGEYEALLFQVLKQATRIEVPPLSYHESIEMLRGLWPNHLPWNEEQADKIVTESEGNPRIIVVMLQAYQQKQKSTQEETMIDDLAVPPSVENLLLQRLRNLSILEQDTLRKAAVVGESFWQGTVESLERMEIPEGNWGMHEGVFISRVDDRKECLAGLVEKKLVVEIKPSGLKGEFEYRFQQKMLQQVLLQQLPVSVRQQMHKKIAQWLEIRYEVQADEAAVGLPPNAMAQQKSPSAPYELTELIAYHLQKAGDHQQAAHYLYKASQRSRSKGKHKYAIRLLSQAWEGLGNISASPLRLKLVESIANSYFHVGDITGALHYYQQALQLSWGLTSEQWAGRLYAAIGQCHARRGTFAEASDALLNSQALLERMGASKDLFHAIVLQIRLALLQGDVDSVELLLQKAKSQQYSKSEDLERKATLLSLQGWLYRLQGKWADAGQALQETSRLLRTMKTPTSRAQALLYESEFYLVMGDEGSAKPILWESIDLLREQEACGDLLWALVLGAQVCFALRETQQALPLLQEAWGYAQAGTEPIYIALVSSALAMAHALTQQTKEAIYFARIAIPKMKKGAPLYKGLIHFFLGEVATILPEKQAHKIMDKVPKQLPEGGLGSYMFIKSLELFKEAGEKARFCSAMLSLARSLQVCELPQAALNVLKRAVKEAEHWGLGLILERIENQKRLIQKKTAHPTPQLPDKLEKGHSTLRVRAPRKSGRRNKRSSSRPEAQSAHPRPEVPSAFYKPPTQQGLQPPKSPAPSTVQPPFRPAPGYHRQAPPMPSPPPPMPTPPPPFGKKK